MAYRILTNEIIMLNHKAFVDHTLESHRFHNSEIQSAVMKPELFHIVVPYDGKPTRDEARDKRKSRKRKRVEDNLDEITQKVSTFLSFILRIANNQNIPTKFKYW